MKSLTRFDTICLVSILLTLCFEANAASTKATARPQKSLTSSIAPDWQKKWSDTVVAAKKEGKLSIYASWGPQVRVALAKAFEEKFGIKLEFIPGRAETIAQRIQTETTAGLNLADAYGMGIGGFNTVLAPRGLLGPLKPLILLPEILDPNVWIGGEMPFGDKEKILAMVMIGSISRTLAYNTNFIKEGEIKSAKDLLRPQYKGKISMKDPLVAGSGIAILTHLSVNLWGRAETIDFLGRLINEQKVAIQRDDRIHVESVAHGKYYIAFGAQQEITARLLEAGAPIHVPLLKEDNRLSAGTGALGVPRIFAHPNAAIVFVNWVLTKEGQSVFAKAFGSPSLRIDASNEGFDPAFVPVAGKKYYSDYGDILDAREEWIEIARKIIEEATK